MPLTHVPTRPMVRVAEPRDIGRVLRYAGRVAHDASLSAARMRDVADVVRTLAISLVLDACGGWIGLHDLGTLGGPGLEVVAFDRHCAHSSEATPHEWHHLRSQLHRLGHLGAAVVSRRTPKGGTALWARISEDPGPAVRAAAAAPEVSGLLQAPPGEPRAGWSAFLTEHRLGITIYDAPGDAPVPATATRRLLRTHRSAALDGRSATLRHVLEGLGDVSAAVIDIDLRNRVVHAATAGSIALTLVADGERACPRDPAADGPALRERSSRWDHSLTLVAHTAGIAHSEDRHVSGIDGPGLALDCAALMRDAREQTPTACVVAARVLGPACPSALS